MMSKSKSDRRSLRAVTVALFGLVLVACGTTTTATESTDSTSSTPDSTPSASPQALTRVAAETFPTVPGIVWGRYTRQDQKAMFGWFQTDCRGHLASADFRAAWDPSDGSQVAVVGVLRFAPQYSTPKALRAEFKRPGRGRVTMHADLGGHDVLVYLTHDPDLAYHFWISGDGSSWSPRSGVPG